MNKVTLNGKGLLGAARGNGAESALAKASKPFSYWQMKSESLSKICDFPQSPFSFVFSFALPPLFFLRSLSLRSYRLHAAGKKSEICFIPLFTNMLWESGPAYNSGRVVWKWVSIKKAFFAWLNYFISQNAKQNSNNYQLRNILV